MSRLVVRTLLTAGLLGPLSLSAQAAVSVPAADQQITAAVLALPKEMRDGAGVLGYRTAGKLEPLRPVKNGMLCLADDPADDRFHVACYHESMEPFMARGRALRAAGTTGARVDTVRYAEVREGKLKMPTQPASLYQLFGEKADYDPAAGTVAKARALFVVYMPGATAQSTGLSTTPSESKPWLMLPGTPKAHIMFSLGM